MEKEFLAMPNDVEIQEKIVSRIDRPIVLVGMMGSGKTSVGNILSDMLGLPYHDSDRLIEVAQGLSVAEIFDKMGETAFRKLEAETILGLLNLKKPSVISTGGGAVINPTVLNAIKEYAFSIWLMADIPTILKRLETDRLRPLLAVPDREQRLRELLKVRKPLYAQADIKIDNSDLVESDREAALRLRLYNALYEFLNLR